MKKILIILLFIVSPLQAEKIEQLSWYNLQELLEDDKLTYKIIKSLNLSSTKTIIGNRQIYTASMGEGKTAVEKQKNGNAVEEIKKLSEQILSEVK